MVTISLRYFLLFTWFSSLTVAVHVSWREQVQNLIQALGEEEKSDVLAEDRQKIVGGTPVAPNEFPFLASVQIDGVHSFTGSVIHPRTILTCGHCLHFMRLDPEMMKEYDVVIGVHNISKSIPAANKFKIQSFHIHPLYQRAAANRPLHDIGLIILDRTIDYGALNVKPAALTNGEFLEDYVDCHVIGWGATSETRRWSDVPRKLPVTVMVDPTVCVNRVRAALTATNQKNRSTWQMDAGNICAISEVGNHCQGDSGGPMWCKVNYENYHGQLALVSTTFGAKVGSVCGRAGGVSIYTSVGPHLHWIGSIRV